MNCVAGPEAFGASGTSVYGPDNLGAGLGNLVGTYTGALDGTTAAGWRRLQGTTQLGIPGTCNFVHSVDGGLAVGNADIADVDGITGYFSLSSTALIVVLATGRQIDIRYPDDRDPLVTHTAYGIWANGNGSYTIAGGSGEVLDSASGKLELGAAYLIDYDSITESFSNYTTFLAVTAKTLI